MSRIRAVFDAALDLPTVERAEFLADVAADEPEVASEVRALLVSDPGANALFGLVRRAAETMEGVDAGHAVGAYRLKQEIGRGGMGTVWLATRADDAYRAEVAIKLLSGTTEPAVRARFEAERQILATLDHPNIARLLDGGTTEDGTPYVVMEYVQGAPIDAYCTENALTVTERLELFRQVCQAIQYAHAALVVHRDIKPSNILVDDRGVPKLLDFGIAKLLKGSLLDTSPDTRTGNHPLTPQYASPEQIRGETCATAADVYGLGVLLNVMLTGALPYRLTSSDPMELAHHVCEVEPRPPSMTVLETAPSGEDAEARQLSRHLEGDLDNIVLMALRKEPRHRYGSAEELAEDVRRHLERHPVSARPATLRYRLGRFVSRHRWGLGAAAASVLLLLGATAFSFVQMRRAVAASEIAEQERALAVVQALRATLAAAASRLDAGEPGAATGLLASVPEQDRGWEWTYLQGTTQASVSVVDLPPDVVTARLSNDGHSVIGVHADGTVRWRNAVLGDVEHELRLGVEGSVLHAGLSAGGARVFVAHGERGERLTSWALVPGEAPSQIGETWLEAAVVGLTVSEDGRSVLAETAERTRLIGPDGTDRHWEGSFSTGAAVASTEAVAVQLLGDTALSYRVLDPHRPGDSTSPVGRDVLSAALEMSGATLYTGETDGHIRVRDVPSGRVVDRLRASAGPPSALALSPDGSRLASAMGSGDIYVWDVASRSVEAVYQGPGDVRALSFDASGEAVAAVGAGRGMWIWDSRRAALMNAPGVAARYGAAGEQAWIASASGELRLVDHPTGELYDVRETGLDDVSGLAVSAEGEVLAILAGGRVTWHDATHPWRGISALDQDAVHGSAPVVALDQSDPGRRIVTLDDEGVWAVWDAEGRGLVATGGVEGGPVAVAISPDGRAVAAAAEEGVVVWNARTAEERRRLMRPDRSPTALSFGPDSRRLAVAWADGSIRLTDLRSGEESEASLPHRGPITALTFSPDGRRLASGGGDGSVWISDPATGSPILELRGHAAAVTEVVFSPDGERLLTSDRADVTRIWLGEGTDARAEASERLRVGRLDMDAVVREELSVTPDPQALSRRIRSDPRFTPRERIAALQLTLDPSPPPLSFARDPFDGFAWESDGSDGHVRVPPHESLRMTSRFTVEAWVQPYALPSGLLDYGVVFNKEGEYQVVLSGEGEIWWIIAGPDGWDEPWKRARYRTAAGVWTHIALVRDGSTVRLLVNGRVAEERAVPAVMGDHHPAMDDFRIGGRQHTPTGFRGRIDEVRIWAVARSPEEIRAGMRARIPADAEGLLAAWSFDEGAGSRASDVTGRHTGTVVGGRWSPTTR